MSKVLVALLFSILTSLANAEKQRPNIVFILADDLGYGELGCFGQTKIKTPNIDQLAAEGMRLTQHYSGAPVCGPARAVLMTGKHLAHSEVRGNREIKNKGKRFGGQHPLSPEAYTIAEMLREQGYTTGAFGKWGLGASDSTGSPIKQGFDRFFGYNCQRMAHSYYPPYLDDNEGIREINKPAIPGHKRQKEGEVLANTYRSQNYAPDLILTESLKFIDESVSEDKPFFLYLPFVEPHLAMQPPQEWIDHYPKDWDQKPYRGNKGYLPHPRPRAGYAAMISDLDEHVGSVVRKLKELNIYDNTLIIFTSDNGATFDIGGVDTKFFNSVSGLRGRKGSCYEGGLRVPTIVRWKGVIAPGSESHVASYFADWLPTLGNIVEADLTKTKFDGIDLTPAFSNNPTEKRAEPMMWEFVEYGGIIAIRDEDWKAIRRGMNKKSPEAWELYNIADDPKETKNLAKEHPERVQKLEQAWLKSRTPNQHFQLKHAPKS